MAKFSMTELLPFVLAFKSFRPNAAESTSIRCPFAKRRHVYPVPSIDIGEKCEPSIIR